MSPRSRWHGLGLSWVHFLATGCSAIALLAAALWLPAAQAQAAGAPSSGSQTPPAHEFHAGRLGLPPGVSARVVYHAAATQQAQAPIDFAQSPAVHWQALRHDVGYEASVAQPLWVRIDLTLERAQEANALVLSLPQPYLDFVRLWVAKGGEPAPQGVGEAAGEYVPRDLWQTPGAFVQHALPELPAGEHSVWLRVVQQGAWRPSIHLTDARGATALRETHVVQQTAVVGFLLATALLSAALAWVHRSGTHGWLAAFAALGAAVLLGINGLASLWMWPAVGRLSERVVPCIAMLQLGSALMCVRWVLRDRGVSVLPHSVLFAAASVALGGMVFVVVDSASLLALGFWGLACGVLVVMAIWQLAQARQQPGLLLAWGLFLVLNMLTLLLGVVEMLGLLRLSDHPTLLPTASLSALVAFLMVAVPLHATRMSERSAHRRLRSEYDPLTGALQPEAARRALQQAWARARAAEKAQPGCIESDIAVAFVRLRSPHNADRALVGQRGVRMLRTVARGQDAVGWIDNSTLMLLMPGLGDDGLTRGMLSRLVALSLMNDATDSKDVYLTVRIAVTTRQNFGESLDLLQASLMVALNPQRGRWGEQPIRWLERPAASDEIQRAQRPRRWWMSSLSAESAVTTDPPYARRKPRVRREQSDAAPAAEGEGLTTGRSPS
jgi:hypothetical protein